MALAEPAALCKIVKPDIEKESKKPTGISWRSYMGKKSLVGLSTAQVIIKLKRFFTLYVQ